MKRNAQARFARLLYPILTALLAALTTALTLLAHIPFPMTSGGYVHLGDGAVYIAACLLPGPYAAAAAAIGCGLADLALGDVLWLPATLIIKACMALLFTAKRPKMLCKRNVLAMLPATLVNVGGYFLYESLFLHEAAMLSVVGNIVQSAIAAGMFLLLAAAMDQLKIKSKFIKWR